MDLMNVIRDRKSIRAFKPIPVKKLIVEKLLRAAIMAPSGSNAQPWKFHVITGRDKKELDDLLLTCSSEAREIFEREVDREQNMGGRTGPRRTEFNNALFELLAKNDMIEKMLPSVLNYYGAPVAIFITVDHVLRENILATGAAIENLLLAAHNEGLGSCWISLPFMRTKSGGPKIKKHLNLPAEEKLIASIAIGYPDEQSPLNLFKSSRDDFDSFVEWIGWD